MKSITCGKLSRIASPFLFLLSVASVAGLCTWSLDASGTVIPPGLLAGVRGGNPTLRQKGVSNCTVLNLATANGNLPPGSTPYVSGGACQQVGTPCLWCNGNVSYTLVAANPITNNPNPHLQGVVDCTNNGAGGSTGQCQQIGNSVLCNATGVYACGTTGSKWATQ